LLPPALAQLVLVEQVRGVGQAGVGVDRRPVVERRAVHEVDRRVAQPLGAHDRDLVAVAAEPDLEVAQHDLERGAPVIDQAVVRQEHPDVVARAPEVLGQRGRDVGEPAGPGVARDLGRDVQDVHAAASSHGTGRSPHSFVIGHQVTDVVANREQAAALVPA
jgi:hypothetical protein